MKKILIDLDKLEHTIEQLNQFRQFMDTSWINDKTEEEKYKTTIIKQSFDVVIAYLIDTNKFIKNLKGKENENK